MRAPSGAELAAIAAAYAALQSTAAPPPPVSRWRRAARIEALGDRMPRPRAGAAGDDPERA
jgi:hypothetical protein